MKTVWEFLSFIWLADKMVPFIRENHPKWRDDSDQDLYDYLAWFWGKDLLAVSFTGEEIYGVCTIKLFSELEDFLSPFVFEPDGKFCMVDLLVAVSPLAIADCFETLFGRWGSREVMIWERGERTLASAGAPRMYTWKQYKRLTRRLTYGVVKDEEGT